MTLLSVSHVRQRQPADCLAACCAMALQYLHVPIRYERLVQVLQIKSFGVPFSNVRRLESLGLSVTVGEGTFAIVEQSLTGGLPVLVNVNTDELRSYWNREASHVVVVVGSLEDEVYLNDPAVDEAPKVVSRLEFELSWDRQHQRYAIIGLTSG